MLIVYGKSVFINTVVYQQEVLEIQKLFKLVSVIPRLLMLLIQPGDIFNLFCFHAQQLVDICNKVGQLQWKLFYELCNYCVSIGEV